MHAYRCEDYQNLIAEVRRQLEIKFTEAEIKIVDVDSKNSKTCVAPFLDVLVVTHVLELSAVLLCSVSETAAQLDTHSSQLTLIKQNVKSLEADGAKRRDELKVRARLTRDPLTEIPLSLITTRLHCTDCGTRSHRHTKERARVENGDCRPRNW